MIEKRIISAVALGVLALVSIFSEILYVVTVTGLVTLGLYEFFSLVERRGSPSTSTSHRHWCRDSPVFISSLS
jgi:hypothetical protein